MCYQISLSLWHFEDYPDNGAHDYNKLHNVPQNTASMLECKISSAK